MDEKKTAFISGVLFACFMIIICYFVFFYEESGEHARIITISVPPLTTVLENFPVVVKLWPYEEVKFYDLEGNRLNAEPINCEWKVIIPKLETNSTRIYVYYKE